MGMTDLLAECGKALYGPQWQSALARDLHVSDRTVRRWIAGSSVPASLDAELTRLVQARAALLNALAARLREAGSR